MAYDAERGLSTADKLELLASALVGVPKEQFCPYVWWNGAPVRPSGCAVGWGVHRFGASLGLTLVDSSAGWVPQKIGANRHYSQRQAHAWSDVLEVIGLPQEEAGPLFCDPAYRWKTEELYGDFWPTVEQVIEGVRHHAALVRAREEVAA